MALAQVRAASADDAGELARVQRVVWTSAYADLLPPGVVEGFDDDAVARGWAASIEAGGDARAWIAVEGSEVVGFAAAGPADLNDLTDATGAVPDDRDRVGAVATLLVEPRWGRRGHGGRLLVEAARFLRSGGSERAIAWIPERDAASRAFYARAGWEPDGTVRVLDAGGRPLRELRLTGPVDLEFAPEPTAADLGLPCWSEGVDEERHERIRTAVASIPEGSWCSYGDVAAAVGERSARVVGTVLAQDGADLPWHRVLRTTGTPAPHIAIEQIRRLTMEGVVVVDARARSDQRHVFDPGPDAAP